MNIIRHKWVFIGFSSLLILAAVFAIVQFGLHEGIDFQGGTLWQIKATTQLSSSDFNRGIQTMKESLTEFFRSSLNIKDAQVLPQKDDIFLVRTPEIDETEHQAALAELKNKYPSLEELRFETIGTSIGSELRKTSLTVFIMVLVGISLYITFAFRKVSAPVASWKYGIITLLTLFHDAIIPIGALAIFGKLLSVEIDITSVVAILVVMGFSVHDTIVVFDRIRENLVLDRGKSEFGPIINRSVNETLARSINTSLTLILVLFALYFAGPITLKYFILTLLVGVITGMYS